jgi:hypothetical protein
MDEEDIMPCGHWDYWSREESDTLDMNGMFSFDPPKMFKKRFQWEDYLLEQNATALPFHLFTDVLI